MAKVQTIQEKREAMENALKRLEAFEIIINKLDHDMKWEYGTIRCDESGNGVKDDDGNYILDMPNVDEYYYDKYIAFKSALEEIKALV